MRAVDDAFLNVGGRFCCHRLDVIYPSQHYQTLRQRHWTCPIAGGHATVEDRIHALSENNQNPLWGDTSPVSNGFHHKNDEVPEIPLVLKTIIRNFPIRNVISTEVVDNFVEKTIKSEC